jgi:NAD(P)-dependent dehydrogenase (short-subunit alcohol dehydrogenase family)
MTGVSLRGKVAIVTGGNSGIGRAIVLELAKKGANLVIDYIMHPEATEALERQVAALDHQAFGVEADVGKVADLERLIDSAVKKFGRLDVMVNNAGIETHVGARHDGGPVRPGAADESQERLLWHPARGSADDQARRGRAHHQCHVRARGLARCRAISRTACSRAGCAC